MTSPKWIDGKLALLLVLALQQRPIHLWGREAAVLFVNAPRAELWRLETPPETPSEAELVTADGQRFRVAEKVDVSQARGFLHLRHSLLSDHSFDWSADTSGSKNWRYAVRFVDGDRIATLLVSDDFRYAMLGKTSAEASIVPIAGGVKKLFEEQLGETE
jgi:hypothetical protein